MKDIKRMLKDIDLLVNNDFCADMECLLIPNSRKYTQEEAKEMANIIASVYSISHCITCKSCGKKYETPNQQ